MTEKRYEAVELEGRWYIFDTHNPLAAQYWCKDKDNAEITAAVFNLMAGAGIEKG